MRPEDDDRNFWVFTHECGCTTSVLTDAGYGRVKAFREMFDGIKPANAALDRGVTAQLVGAPEFHQVWAEKIEAGHQCLS